MKKSQKQLLYFIFLLIGYFMSAQDQPPILMAIGNQVFCPRNPINIVTNFSITDVDDTTIEAFFIQISSGYQINFDRLDLTGTHPNIVSVWNENEAKLTLKSINTSAEMLLIDIENAVKEVVFSTTSNNVVANKSFSLSIDNANYLPLTDHFYEFVPSQGITWKNAKAAAENRTYFGRQGYLATLISEEEANFAGKQASGAGWIGGSDEETEGRWKWVTGPESGTIFWNGQVNGATPNYANWNDNEPNNLGNEDYAHITDPSIGIRGAWNDLSNEGGTGLYIPRGYIVEYGIPEDPPLNIVATTRIYIPQITATTSTPICESGSTTITATPSEGVVLWYNTPTGGTPLTTGNAFTTPSLSTNRTYYATISVNGCNTLNRTAVSVNIRQKPTITNITEGLICYGFATISATPSTGKVDWFQTPTSSTPIFTGNNFSTPFLNSTTSYYVEANDLNCTSSSRTEVKVIVDATTPEFELIKETYFLCAIEGSVTLETNNALGNYRYVWKKGNTIISSNSASIQVNESGNYSVKAISLSGCESIEKEIIVMDSDIATIKNEDITLVDDSNNNSIEVITTNLGTGNYEFSLDDEFGLYKDTSLFQNITTGIHVLFIRDKNGCGITAYEFSILAYPKFFTPNGDGKNDVWKIDGFNSSSFSIMNISIYNRFGELITRINTSNESWDGRYQGKILPSDTYWFRVILNDNNGRIIDKTGRIGLIIN